MLQSSVSKKSAARNFHDRKPDEKAIRKTLVLGYEHSQI